MQKVLLVKLAKKIRRLRILSKCRKPPPGIVGRIHAALLAGPLDGSEASDDALQQAIGVARGDTATLHLLHVIDSFPVMFELSAQTSFETMKQSLRSWSEGMLGSVPC